MSEYATLTIKRKITKKPSLQIYANLFKLQGNPERTEAYKRENIEDLDGFGEVSFSTKIGGIYVEHIPNNFTLRSHEQVRSELSIPSEWLFCFSYSEMSVIGLDLGVFQAETSVKDAIGRLRDVSLPFSSELYKKRDRLWKWLIDNASEEDYLCLCSQWIYYHPEGKYDYAFVQKDINRKISLLKKEVSCLHWTKQYKVS